MVWTPPWLCKRCLLPQNEKRALQSLYALERKLAKNPELAEDYCQQIEDMVCRGVAIELSEEELRAWNGHYHYLPLLGVKGKKKWLRVVFYASYKQPGGLSFNDCVAKGPDRFLNNLLSVCLGFRNGRVAAAADIKKFHNQVRLFEDDIHMQRFFWRGMKTDEPPKTFAVTVNNFGVSPANCIATSALHKSADEFSKKYPVASIELKEQTYIDDQLVAAPDMPRLHEKTVQMDEILDHAGMSNKGWTFSGDAVSEGVAIGVEDDVVEEKVLGMLWIPGSDTLQFLVVLTLKLKSGKVVQITCRRDLQEIME